MRARNIKPNFYKNEDLANCSVWARYLCPGLWMLADRDGRLEDRPKRIKAELLAFDTVDAEPLLKELEQHGHILRYVVNGLPLIQILKFAKHQSPHHTEKKGVLPPPSSREIHRDAPGVLLEHHEIETRCQPPPLPPDSLIHRFTDSSSPNGDAPATASKSVKPSKKAGKFIRLPFDDLPIEWQSWAIKEFDWSTDIVTDVWANFRDYWQVRTGKMACKSDWLATWRNWCRQQSIRTKGPKYDAHLKSPATPDPASRSHRFKQFIAASAHEELTGGSANSSEAG